MSAPGLADPPQPSPDPGEPQPVIAAGEPIHPGLQLITVGGDDAPVCTDGVCL